MRTRNRHKLERDRIRSSGIRSRVGVNRIMREMVDSGPIRRTGAILIRLLVFFILSLQATVIIRLAVVLRHRTSSLRLVELS